MINRLKTAILASALILVPAIGGAGEGVKKSEEPTFPKISASISIEFQNDATYSSDNRDEERNDLYTTTEPEVILALMKGLTIRLLGTIEPVSDPQPREDRYFEDHGMYLNEFEIAFEHDWFRLHGGKYTPNFGRAWDNTPGVYGTDFAEDYELSERIGLGGSVTFGNDIVGTHTVGFSTFFLDTSIFAESAPQRRDRTFLSQGGVANTEKFNSWVISIDGEGMQHVPELSYHLAFVSQAPSEEGDPTLRELGFVAGLAYTYSIGDFNFIPSFEYARFSNAEGVENQKRFFGTIGLGVEWHNWNAAISNTWRYTRVSAGTDNDDNHFQISAGYAFDFGLSLDIGWKLTESEKIESQTFGGILAYTIEF